MLPTVRERRRNAPFFHQSYTDICYLRNIVPIPLVKSRADKNILDVCGDKLNIDEWIPIIEALKQDRSLHYIAVHSNYPSENVLEEIDTERKIRSIKKYPALFTRYVLKLLIESIALCISVSKAVTCIELEGIPLKSEYIDILCKGLTSNKSLQSISLHNSPIGDLGCRKLCSILKNLPSVFYLDLCNCDLSLEGAIEIAGLLKYQSLQRFAESWKHSLRYRDPNTEQMPGLRRITLNNNAAIGDDGVQYIADILKEDIWLKAIDLQNCGISNSGALKLLEMLTINCTLYIVDVRDNTNIHNLLINQIMVQLYKNYLQNENTAEFNWTVPSSQLNKTKRPRAVNSKNYFVRTKRGSSAGNEHNIYQFSSQFISSINATEPVQFTKSPSIFCNCPQEIDDQMFKIKYNAELLQTRKKLQNTTERLEREISFRMETELKLSNLEKRNRELENELLKKQNEKEGFCLVRVEAYEAILDAFRKFSIVMEDINTNLAEEEHLMKTQPLGQ